MQRNYNPIDNLLIGLDQTVKTLFGKPDTTERTNPAAPLAEAELTEQETRHITGLMRVNHTGEVCAQALYQGQAMTARLPKVRESMERAAMEENDHLDWCYFRLQELNSHTSYLNPLWYAGSFALGATAGLIGDKWSLGFVAETEDQVVKHLDSHLQEIPQHDAKSRAILEQMRTDEQNHGENARNAGGASLPSAIKNIMQASSKVMTTIAYKI